MDRMMFLHSGASLHGHEYSTRPNVAASSQAATNLRSPLIRSALAPAKPRANQNADGRTAPVLRQRAASDYIPRKALTPEPIVRFQEVEEEKPAPVMPEDSVLSESELSEATAFSIDGPTTRSVRGRGTRRRRQVPHHSTKYFLGYPAPRRLPKTKVMQKVFSRLLLQLQVVSEDGRSRPVLEVFPSTRIAGPVIAPRLAKRFPGIFGVKHHLGYDDIVLVRRDDDDSLPETEVDPDESLEKKLLLAVYSPVKHSDEAEIVLEDGSVWVAKPLPNGSYDFVHTDIHGITTTVRWARRSTACATSVPTETPLPPDLQARYTFSIINPLTRRHPVMATLTPSTLEVQDTYTSVSSSYGRYPPHRAGRTVSMTSSVSWADVPDSPSKRSSLGSIDGESDNRRVALASEIDATRTVRPVEDSTKKLIAVTGLWVALKSEWSANIRPANSDLTNSPSCSTRCRRNTWSRTTSEVTPQPSESEEVRTEPKRHSMPLMTAEKQAIPSPSRTPTPSQKGSPHRATSTGAAFMQRRNQKSDALEKEVGRRTKSIRTRPPGTTPSVTTTELVNGRLDGVAEATHGVGGERDGAAKKGMRSRLVRWIHKLGWR